MPNRTQTLAVGMTAWLEVVGSDVSKLDSPGYTYKFDISAVVSEFVVNKIPVAQVRLTAGTMVKKSPASPSVRVTDLIKQMDSQFCRVMLQTSGKTAYVSKADAFSGSTCIFKGRITDPKLEIDPFPTIVVTITHWLGELNNLHWLTGLVDPGVPDSWIMPLGFTSETRDESGGNSAVTGAQSVSVVIDTMIQLHFSKDLWYGNADKGGLQTSSDALREGHGLRALFATIAARTNAVSTHVANTVTDQDRTGITSNPPDTNALYALGRINDQALAPALALYDGKSYRDKARNILCGHVGEYLAAPSSANTMWNKLSGLLNSAFELDICPAVHTAYIAPTTPGCAGTLLTLTSNDIMRIRGIAMHPRALLKGIIMFADPADYAKVLNIPVPTPQNPTAMAYNAPLGVSVYVPPGNESATGYYGYCKTPQWLLAAGFIDASHKPTTDTTSSTSATGSGTSTDATSLAAVTAANNESLAAQQDWAHALYLKERYKDRSMMVETALRFDICPGSTVVINPNIGDNDSLPIMKGIVMGVTININEQAPVASTSLAIGYIQLQNAEVTEAGANNANQITINPLYSTLWLGAPLLKADGT